MKWIRDLTGRLCRITAKIFVTCWSRLPLVGGLTKTTAQGRGEAAKEFAALWFLSVLPIILLLIVDLAVTAATEKKFSNLWPLVYTNVKAGEIFIFANALLAPCLVILYKHNRDQVSFPNHLAFLIALFVTVPVCSLIFGLQRAGVIRDQHFIDIVALLLYPFAILLRWLAIAYDTIRVDYAKATEKQEDELQDRLKPFADSKNP